MRKVTHVLLAALFVLILTVPVMLFGATETSHTERSFPAKAGGQVMVDASFHKVEVTARPGSTVDIVVDLEISASAKKAKQLLADYQPRFETNGDDIEIKSTRAKAGWNWGTNRTKGLITVAMPPGMDLVVDNSSGSVHLKGDFGDAKATIDNSSGSVIGETALAVLSIDNSSGRTEIDVFRPLEEFRVDCSSGSVYLEGGAKLVEVDTSSGSVHLAGLLGNATVGTSSGSVELAWTTIVPNSDVRIDTSSGGVELKFPEGISLEGEIDTSSGGIRSDFPCLKNDRDHCELTGGPGAVRLAVDTSSGGVRLIQ